MPILGKKDPEPTGSGTPGEVVEVPDYSAKPYSVNPKKEDNWEHRSENMRCKTCWAYVTKKKPLGRCRTNAPTMRGFPVVFESDWCCQHKLDENKIPDDQ